MRLQKEEPESQPVVREQEFWNSELLLLLCVCGDGGGVPHYLLPKSLKCFSFFFFF